MTIGNALIAALPRGEAEIVGKAGELVVLPLGELIAAAHTSVLNVYFPLDSAIAVMSNGGDNQSLAVGLVGREGMLGAELSLRSQVATLRAQVGIPGRALRISVDEFYRVLADAPSLDGLLKNQVVIQQAQYAQMAACAAFHSVEMRLAWWLLMTHDRVPGDRFEITQLQLATMLGVRRSGVTHAAGDMRERRLIDYTRGRIVIRDRRGLERTACGCYRLMRAVQRRFETVTTTGGNVSVPGLVRPLRRLHPIPARRIPDSDRREALPDPPTVVVIGTKRS